MNRPNKLLIFLVPVYVIMIYACKSEPRELKAILLDEIKISVNPYDKVPLGALLSFTTKEECQVQFKIDGAISVGNSIPGYRRYHEIPVTGLYANTLNRVELLVVSKKERQYVGEVLIKTDPLPDVFPEIEITKLDRAQMEPGFHLIDMLIANNGFFLYYTIMFDDNGAIRWFMDMSSTGKITYTPYRLKNGNWLYLSWIDMFEVDQLGQVVHQQQLWGHAGDHDLTELANGNILMGGSKKDAVVVKGGQTYPSRYDFVVEWDRRSNRAVRDWDLRKVLDIGRSVYPADYSLDVNSDWFHINSVDLSGDGSSLLVSGRNQCVLKMNSEGELKWILAPHKDWGKSGYNGQGPETSDFLLTAVDADGKPLPDDVQRGERGTDDFEWSTGQHAATFLDNGNILLFDNGLMRNFVRGSTYSRAVEYEIDENARTIKQKWQYGKSRGLDMYSAITSDIDVLPETGNRLITAGNIRADSGRPHAKLIEITYPENVEVFEANVYFKDALGTQEQSWAQFDLVYRGERYSLFHEKDR